MKKFVAAILALTILASPLRAQSIPGAASGNEGVVKKASAPVGVLTACNSGSNITHLPGMSFGTPDPGRWLTATVWLGSVSTLSGLTIGGVPATTIFYINNGGGQLMMASAFVPTGTSGEIIATWGPGTGTILGCLYSMIGFSNPTTPTFQTSATSFSPTLTVANGGFVLAAGGAGGAATTFSGNLTVDIDQVQSTSHLTMASKAFPTGGSIPFTLTNTGGLTALGIAAFSP